MLASGLHGIEMHLEPPEPVEEEPGTVKCLPSLMVPEPFKGDIFKLSQEERTKLGIESLPSNLGEAIAKMEKSEFMWDVFGPTLMNHFLTKKKQEYDDYRTQVSQWELENQLPIL